MNDMALDYAQHRFTVDEYHRMADAGVFPPDAHIELVDGDVVATRADHSAARLCIRIYRDPCAGRYRAVTIRNRG